MRRLINVSVRILPVLTMLWPIQGYDVWKTTGNEIFVMHHEKIKYLSEMVKIGRNMKCNDKRWTGVIYVRFCRRVDNGREKR